MKLDKDNDLIEFDSIEEAILLKNYLIFFIKKTKKEVKDRGNDPQLIINVKNLSNG